MDENEAEKKRLVQLVEDLENKIQDRDKEFRDRETAIRKQEFDLESAKRRFETEREIAFARIEDEKEKIKVSSTWQTILKNVHSLPLFPYVCIFNIVL